MDSIGLNIHIGCIGVCNTTRVSFAFTATIRMIHYSESKSFFFHSVLFVYYSFG